MCIEQGVATTVLRKFFSCTFFLGWHKMKVENCKEFLSLAGILFHCHTYRFILLHLSDVTLLQISLDRSWSHNKTNIYAWRSFFLSSHVTWHECQGPFIKDVSTDSLTPPSLPHVGSFSLLSRSASIWFQVSRNFLFLSPYKLLTSFMDGAWSK